LKKKTQLKLTFQARKKNTAQAHFSSARKKIGSCALSKGEKKTQLKRTFLKRKKKNSASALFKAKKKHSLSALFKAKKKRDDRQNVVTCRLRLFIWYH
jgi:hypothetical protein